MFVLQFLEVIKQLYKIMVSRTEMGCSEHLAIQLLRFVDQVAPGDLSQTDMLQPLPGLNPYPLIYFTNSLGRIGLEVFHLREKAGFDCPVVFQLMNQEVLATQSVHEKIHRNNFKFSQPQQILRNLNK